MWDEEHRTLLEVPYDSNASGIDYWYWIVFNQPFHSQQELPYYYYTPEYPVGYSGYNNITRSTTQELETHDTWLWHHCTTRVASACGAPVGRYFNHALATLSQISVIMADMVKCMINIDLHFVLPCGQEEIFCWVHKWNFWNICCRKLAVSDFFTNSKIHVSRWNWATLAIVIIQM